jgi:hypothetical protein
VDKIKYFNDTADMLYHKAKLGIEIRVKQDNRLGRYSAHVQLYECCGCDDKFYLFRYNTKELKNATKLEILMTILHEFGHIKYRHNGDTDRIKKEYIAEKYAMKMIKKHYPKLYKRALGYLEGYKNHEDRVYKIAFTKLYKELTCKK